jgi:hypothetical protein
MATRKIRKFNEGGVSADDLEAANASEDPIQTLNARKGWTGGDDEAPIAPAATARKQSFKEAFAEARRGGDKTFEWNGKKYTTEMSGQKPATKPAAKPAARVTDTGDETARLAARRTAPAKPKFESSYDRMTRRNREEAAARAASTPRGQDRILRDVRPGAVNPNTLLPTGMKKGGVVSKASGRADGIAQRGKTRGKIY